MNRLSEEELRRITEEKGFIYDHVEYTNGTKIFFYCKKHMNKGIQCRLLGGMRKSKGKCIHCQNKQKDTDEFIAEVNDKFNNNIEVLEEYQGSHKKIKYLCKIHNVEFNMTPTTILAKDTKFACPTCRGLDTGNRCKKTHEEFICELNNINPNIIPLEEYKTNNEKILCKCKIHDYVWKVAPSKILHKTTGCPKCNSYNNENKIFNILQQNGYNVSFQKRFNDCKDKNPLPFDIYINDKNTVIEYDGEQHYKPIPRGNMSIDDAIEALELTKYHDDIKTKYCIKNKINIIRIPYWEADNIENILYTYIMMDK